MRGNICGMDNFEALADRGEETEADARDRLAAQWQLQAPRMLEFLETYFELTVQIARAACAYDDVPSELHRVEMVRAVDTAREAFIQQELRL